MGRRPEFYEGETVMVEHNNNWKKAFILEVSGDECLIQHIDKENSKLKYKKSDVHFFSLESYMKGKKGNN